MSGRRSRRTEKAVVFLVFVTPELETPEGREAVARRLSRDLFWTIGEGWRIEYWGYRPGGSASWGPVRVRGPRLSGRPPLSALRTLRLFASHFALTVTRPRAGVLFAYDPYAAFGAALARAVRPGRAPLVVHVAWGAASRSFAVRGSKVRSRVVGALERFVLRRADLVIAVGEFTRRLARDAGATEDRILEVPGPPSWEADAIRRGLRPVFGIPERVEASSATNETNTGEGRTDVIRIVCAARLDADKGVDVLLRSFASIAEEFPRLRLELAGDGSERTDLERLAERLGIAGRVRFRGWVPPREMEDFYRGAVAKVLPSVFEEGLPKVCVEAGLAGCALVGSDIGGIPDVVIPGETGILVPPGDVGRLAEAIRHLVVDPSEARRLGAGARKRSLDHLERRSRAVAALQERFDALMEGV